MTHQYQWRAGAVLVDILRLAVLDVIEKICDVILEVLTVASRFAFRSAMAVVVVRIYINTSFGEALVQRNVAGSAAMLAEAVN